PPGRQWRRVCRAPTGSVLGFELNQAITMSSPISGAPLDPRCEEPPHNDLLRCRTICRSARDLALALDLHTDQRLPTRFLVEVGQGAFHHGPQGQQQRPMRAPDVAARHGGVRVAQRAPWYVDDLHPPPNTALPQPAL